jgi:sugar lactone lactonase YvrE
LEGQLADQDAAHKQEIVDLKAVHSQEMAALISAHEGALKAQEDACLFDTTQAYDDGFAAGMESCSSTSPGNGPVLNGSWSTGDFQPNAVDVDDSGNVFILDYDDKAVVAFDSSGNQGNPWSSSMLRSPVDLAVDAQGNVLILDEQSPYHVQKYSSGGSQFDWTLNTSALAVPLTAPQGLFIDSQNRIYVTDAGGLYGGRVLVFNSSGTWLMTFGEVQQTANETYIDVAVNPQDQYVYVLMETGVAIFDPDGNFDRAWQGGFTQPTGLAIGAQGEVFVADGINHEIYQYDSDGTLNYTFAADDLQDPGRLAVDDAGKLYIGDYTDLQIRIYQ